jgi:hypothetical protein
MDVRFLCFHFFVRREWRFITRRKVHRSTHRGTRKKKGNNEEANARLLNTPAKFRPLRRHLCVTLTLRIRCTARIASIHVSFAQVAMDVKDGFPSSSNSQVPSIIGESCFSTPEACSRASFGVPMSGSGRRGSICMGDCGKCAALPSRTRLPRQSGDTKEPCVSLCPLRSILLTAPVLLLSWWWWFVSTLGCGSLLCRLSFAVLAKAAGGAAGDHRGGCRWRRWRSGDDSDDACTR